MKRPYTHFAFLLSLALLMLLSACGGENTQTPTRGTVSSPNTPTTTSAENSTPTAQTSSEMQIFQGKLYSIKYPNDWRKTENGDGVNFTNDAKGYLTVQVTSNPGGLSSTSVAVNTTVEGLKKTFKNVKDEEVASSNTVGGAKWEQKAISGDVTANNETRTIKAVIMATNQPENSTDTKLYLIIYSAETKNFDQVQASVFSAMLQSFKFA